MMDGTLFFCGMNQKDPVIQWFYFKMIGMLPAFKPASQPAKFIVTVHKITCKIICNIAAEAAPPENAISILSPCLTTWAFPMVERNLWVQ